MLGFGSHVDDVTIVDIDPQRSMPTDIDRHRRDVLPVVRLEVANELEPLQAAMREVNEWAGEEIVSFRSYSLDGAEDAGLDPSR